MLEGFEEKYCHGDYFPVAFIKQSNATTQFIFINRQRWNYARFVSCIFWCTKKQAEYHQCPRIWKVHLEANLFALANEIIERKYTPKPSIWFILDKPVKRQIFAADFRDRVIHHLFYNFISPVFEKSFINDSYSRIKGKGTHYGIKRIDHFIRSCSNNYTKECYILKLDIKGYFMAMNKSLLFNKVRNELTRNKSKVDFDLGLVLYLNWKNNLQRPKRKMHH